MRVRLVDKRIELDGVPAVLVAGEVHYFRVPRVGWARRLDLLVAAGANTVATYVPWGVHDTAGTDTQVSDTQVSDTEGTDTARTDARSTDVRSTDTGDTDAGPDLTGRTRPELDVGAFLDLCADRGLSVIARPGPFVMAELRHEGVPGWLARRHPEIVPRGWDGRPTPTGALDYLAPAFLDAVAEWYRAVAEVLTPRLAPAGGPVVAIQLDNEIGMLSWAANSPDRTDRSDAAFARWWADRSGGGPGPGPAGRSGSAPAGGSGPGEARTPEATAFSAGFRRAEWAAYLSHLRQLAREVGWGDVPHLVNVHGTAGGRATPFGIGVSQLRTAVRGQDQLATGSDHYVGRLDFPAAAELFTAHAFLDCVNGADQPLTSLEFEAGTGDYGADLGADVDPESVVLKTGLLLAMGVRLVNFYLFAGGGNPVDPRPGDTAGDRIGITGERHGTAAPVTPEGEPGVAYPSTAAAMRLLTEHAAAAATWRPEHDDLALGFVADHFATDIVDPADPAAVALARELEGARGNGPRALLPRALLAAGFRFGALDLQAEPRPGGGPGAGAWPTVIAVGSPSAWPTGVLGRLLEHADRGGRILLVGAVPTADLSGRPDPTLTAALGLTVGATVTAGPDRFPAVRGAGLRIPELRADRLQHLDCPGARVLLVEAGTDVPCAVRIRHGRGLVDVLATDAPLPVPAWAELLAGLGAVPGLTRTPTGTGIISGTTRTPGGERFLHVLNLSGYAQRITFGPVGEPPLTLDLPARRASVSPLP